ncbi:MAG: hypothetical protein VX819_06140, partial [Pseudomonadota bacterium]|nr:hypothetical protein [Pseudomonadota bacterium]
SVLISLVGMPVASYPSGELNAVYDLTMYVSGFLTGGLAILVYAPSVSKGRGLTVVPHPSHRFRSSVPLVPISVG